VTNSEGKATVNITLPDNLTTWRMDARAVNDETLVGQNTLDLISSKTLLVRPQTPRFFVAGDQVTLGAAIHNNSEQDLQVEVKLEGKGLELTTAASQSVQIPANSQAYTSWQAVVEAGATRVDLLFSAEGGGFNDQTRPPQGILDNQGIPVYHYSAPEVVGTSGQMLEAGTQLEAISLPGEADTSQGDLTVRINPSLAASMTDGVTYLEDFPYECIEQTISRFLPNVMTVRALQDAGKSDPLLEQNLDKTVEASLQRLYNWQNSDGGWGWWQNGDSDSLTSAYVVLGLVEADTAGYEVSKTVLSNGLDYLVRQLVPIEGLTEPDLLNRQTFLLYVLARADRPAVSFTVQTYDQRQNLAIYAKAFLTQTLAWIDENDPRLDNLLSDFNTTAITSATGTHWEEKEDDRWNWNTDTRTTAIVLSVLSLLDPENPINANAARWLISHRQDGHWSGTQETAWTLMALANWMTSSGELEANYLYGVTLNGEKLGGGQANSENLTQTSIYKVDIADLLKGQVNRLAIARDAGPGNLYYSAYLNVYLPVQQISSLSQGITISRSYYKVDDIKTPVQQASQGDLILARLTIVVPEAVHYLVINDPLPAGLEAVDQSLSTSPQSVEVPQAYSQEDLFWRGWGWWNFSHIEYRDEKVVLSTDFLPAGTYIYTYLARASTVGEFNTIPPTANEFYFPEVYGRGNGSLFTVIP
jgi:alpha-2-macroglobulin